MSSKELYNLFKENGIGHLWGKPIAGINLMENEFVMIEFEDGTMLEVRNGKNKMGILKDE